MSISRRSLLRGISLGSLSGALPPLAGMKTEVVIQKVHRTGYDHAVRSTGARLVEVETEDELVRARMTRRR